MAKALNVSLAVTADTGQAKQQLQQLQQSLQQLTTSSANLQIGINATEIQKASQAALELSAHLKTATNINTGTIDFTKLNSSIRSSGQSLEQYGQQLLKLGPQGRQAFMQLAQSVAKSEIPIKRLSGVLGNFGTVLANTVRWQLSSSMIHGFIGAIQNAYGYAQDLNKSLNNIQIVTEMSDTQMSKFAVTANKAAKALSTTTTSYTDAALIYYQQGIRDEKEITQRTNATIKMANVTGQSAQKVSDQMTAIWNNFADGSTNLEYYADVITALGAATASSSEEISRGLEKFAAIADTVGLSYENATAALATITATTRQSADTVGTGLRTLFSRLQSLSLGETLEDGVNLTKYSKALQTVGVEVLDATGNLRRMDDILSDLGEKWNGLTKAQQTALAQTVGGVRQYTTLVALMDNIDFYKENLEVAKNSEGTLERQQQIYEKSWAAAAKRVRASAESIYSNLIDDKFFTKLTDNFAKFLDILNNVITGLGGMKGILLGLGGALTATFGDKAAAGLYKFGVGIRDMFTSPKVLAGRRDAFVANAAGIYAGLPINTKTGYIQGATFNKKTGQLDMSGVSMTRSQSQMYNAMASQLAVQQTYSRNAKFMTPVQQLAAQMAMDQQARTSDALFQAQERNKQSQQAVGARAGDLYGQIVSSNKRGSIGYFLNNRAPGQAYKYIARNADGTIKYSQTIRDNDSAATALDFVRTDFESNDKRYAQALDMLGKMQRGEMSTTGLTDQQREILGIEKGYSISKNGKFTIESLQKDLTQKRQTNRMAAQQEFTKLGGSSAAFAAYANAYQESLKAGMTEEEAKKAAELARKNAEKAAGATSPGMKFAQGATNVMGGLMSASAAQAGIESLSNTISQAQNGLISMGQAASQGLAAIAQTGFNAARSWSQFSAVLGPIGGAIATIATIALPYVIEGIDKLITTPEEILENLHKNTERAATLAQEAKQAYDDLMNGFSGHSAMLDSLNELTKGTLEFNRALLEANNAAYQLIDKYNLSNNDWYVDSNGAVQFQAGVQERLQTEAFKREQQTQADAYMAKAIENNYKTQYQANKAQEIYQNILQTGQKQQENKINQLEFKIRSRENTEGWGYQNWLRASEAERERYTNWDANRYKAIDELKNELELLKSAEIPYDYSPLEAYYNKNKDSFAQNMDYDTFRDQVINGTLEANERLANGTAAYNRQALTAALLADSGQTKLSDIDQLLVNALSNDDQFLHKTETEGSTLQNVERSKKWWERVGDFFNPWTVATEAAIGTITGDMSEYNKLISPTVTEEVVDLQQELTGLSVEELKKKYKELGISDEEIKAIEESADYQKLNDTERQQHWAGLIQTRKTTQAQVESEKQIKQALIEAGSSDTWEKLRNYTELTGDELLELSAELNKLADEESNSEVGHYFRQIGNQLVLELNKINSDILHDATKSLSLNEKQRDKLSEELYKNGIKNNEIIQRAYNNFNNAYGSTAKNWALDKIVGNGLNNEIAKKLADFNFSGSVIQDLLNIKQGKSTLGKYTESLAQEGFNIIKSAAGGEKGLLEELYQSDDFQGNLKTLQKELKKTGQISAKTLLDMGEELGAVNDLFEVSNINAQGLADILTSLEVGDIGMDNVTTSLMQALSIAGEVQNTLAECFSYIDTFKQERSVQDIGKFASGLVKSIDSGFESGAFFDPQVLQAWGTIFGKESLGEYRDFFVNHTDKLQTPQEIQKAFQERFELENLVLDSIAETGNLSGLFSYYDQKGPLQGKQKMFSWNAETQQVQIDDNIINSDLYESQDDFIKGLQENYGLDEWAAKLLAGELSGYAPALAQKWANNAFGEGLKALTQEEKENGSITDRDFILNDELESFLNNYKDIIDNLSHDELGQMLSEAFDIDISDLPENLKDIADIIDYIKKKQQENPNSSKKIIDIPENIDLKNPDEIKKSIGEDNYDTMIGARSSDEHEGKIVDIKKVQEAYKKFGSTAESVNADIQGGLDKGAFKVLSMDIMNADGQMETIYSDSEEFLNEMKKVENQGKDVVDVFENWGNNLDESNRKAIAFNEATAPIIAGIREAFTAEDENGKTLIQSLVDQFKTVNPNITFTSNVKDIEQSFQGLKGSVTLDATVILPNGVTIAPKASGYNNSKGFAGGKHVNGQYTGLAEVGELGPELWIHDGEPYLAGVHGRTKAYIHPDDQIYTAAQTREILNDNPSLQDIPGFYVGYQGWKRSGGGSSNASADNTKTSKWEPERYHLITRQLKDLQREYDRLSKIKDNAYGTNKLEAIQKEIELQDYLIEGQKRLIAEVEDYIKIDVERLQDLLEDNEFIIDENGNLENFEELQQKYRKAAEEDKDEHAQDVWKALNQYEETLDKLQEANVEMQDLLYQEMELRLEKITTKAELKIDFDEREIKLLDHYIKHIDDNIYHTAEVLGLTEQKLGHINQKIEDTKEGINGLFNELSDSEGNKITKEDGSNYTLEEWLALTKEQRDLLDINDNFGKQLEEYMDNILEYIEELEEFKTKGVEEFGEAFDELNDDVRSSIDLFDHYNQLLESLRNITDLQGIKLSAEMRAAIKDINNAMFNNTQNNVDAERENYRRLSANVADLRKKIAETQDETLKRQWEDQLKTAEEELRTSEQNLLSLWQTGLEQAKDMFETALEDAATTYEETIAGMYGTTDELQRAWDQQKKNDEFYVKDYEKYYQIQKLQRSITKDLDAAARSGNRQNQGLKKLFDELNEARENGVELSSYDLDIFAKRYEYEKALMELEDARNNKSEVRLQRDANGNWGYVYTSSADDDDLIAKQQAVDDKFYELQKTTQERVASLSDDMLSEISNVGRRLQELRSNGASQETINKYLEQERKYLDNYRKGLDKALIDAGMTEEEARLRYGNEGFDILDQFGETLLSSITGGNETLDDFFERVGVAMDGTNEKMEQANKDYEDNMKSINDWFNESGEDLTTVIKGFASVINSESNGNLIDSKEQIQNAKDTFDEILKVATDFEKKFLEIYQPIINANEKLVADLLYALHALNREEYEGPGHNNPDNKIQDLVKEGIQNSADKKIVNNESNEGGNIGGGDTGGDKPGKEEFVFIEGYAEYNESDWCPDDNHNHVKTIAKRKHKSDPLQYEYKYQSHTWEKDGKGGKVCTICGMRLPSNDKKTTTKEETNDGTNIGSHPPYAQNYNPSSSFNIPDYLGLYLNFDPKSPYPYLPFKYFDTGGYTGSWGSQGRIAMLHEKELVLDKDDTKNFLNATNILRTIDLQANLFSKGLGNIITPWIGDMKTQSLDQDVHIEATFPNVQDHNEIEIAFDNLINKASQYANRKNMSSMTFQDMYTSKF